MHVPRFFTEPFRLRTWKETGYAVAALPLGVAWFSIFLTLGTTSISLIVFVVGLPLLALTMWLVRVAARIQREVANVLLDARIEARPTVPAPEGQSRWRRLLAPVLDPADWRALAYLLLFAFPIGLGLFIAAVVLWSVALFCVTAPVWYYIVPADNRGDFLWDGNTIDSSLEWVAVVGGGLVLLFITPWIVRALTRLDAVLMRALLGPTRGELERAAARSAEQRDLAVSSAAGDRRQIERDLHDGAQPGSSPSRSTSAVPDAASRRATRRTRRPSSSAAPTRRRSRLSPRSATSRAGSTRPSSPTAGWTRRSRRSPRARPVPVAVRSDLGDERPPEQVESAAYFVVAEALTNVAKHARGHARG